jgi:hypothetical protein
LEIIYAFDYNLLAFGILHYSNPYLSKSNFLYNPLK